jgi:hypothetical protein
MCSFTSGQKISLAEDSVKYAVILTNVFWFLKNDILISAINLKQKNSYVSVGSLVNFASNTKLFFAVEQAYTSKQWAYFIRTW